MNMDDFSPLQHWGTKSQIFTNVTCSFIERKMSLGKNSIYIANNFRIISGKSRFVSYWCILVIAYCLRPFLFN